MEDQITFTTSDGKLIKVSRALTKLSVTIGHMLSDSEYSSARPLVIDFPEATMTQVFKFCELYAQNPKLPTTPISDAVTPQARAEEDKLIGEVYCAYAKELFANRPLFDSVFDASDFLDIPPLRAFLSRTIARELVGKSTREMCNILHYPIPTEEEELQRIQKLLHILHQEAMEAKAKHSEKK